MPEIIINGSEGRIEGRYHHSDIKGAPVVLVLHPHPLYGGTMNNKIVYRLYHIFAQNGFSVLRFNFRGVGKSQGKYDEGIGELTDAATALDWLQLQNPDAPTCWIAGFSFGAWIALQLLMRRPEIEGFAAVSPPANLYDFSFLSPCPAAGIITQGDRDDVVSEEAVSKLATRLGAQHGSQVEYKIIPGADHYYRGVEDELSLQVNDYIVRRMADFKQKRKVRPDRKRRQLPRD
jgi:alpha/beta superfamily hydrolase